MCRNGFYTERGIKQRNGYGTELFRVEPEFLVKIDPALRNLGVLLEPASVVAKAWEQIDAHGRAQRGLAASHCARHRRRAGRPAGGADRRAARTSRCMCSTARNRVPSPISHVPLARPITPTD